MKEFDLEKAKAGAKVCTRDGREARIVCFDMKGEHSIIGLVPYGNGTEYAHLFCSNGKYLTSGEKYAIDLMLAGEKKEGWVNVYSDNSCGFIYATREEAISEIKLTCEVTCLDTIHIEWEE